jgi:hypothetical protein
VLVGDLEREAGGGAGGGRGTGADGLAAAGQRQGAGAADVPRPGAAGGQRDLLDAAEQVDGGLGGVLGQQQVAIGVVGVGRLAGAGGVGGDLAVVGPGEGLAADQRLVKT